MPGRRYETLGIPPLLENTTMVPGGQVTFGIEYRFFNEETVQAGKPPEEGATLQPDQGLSIHVYGTESGNEVLRFDCFEENPHYHYMYHRLDPPSSDHVDFDAVVSGDPLQWVLRTLDEKLPDMLAQAGEADLAKWCRTDDGSHAGLDMVTSTVTGRSTRTD